MASSRDSREPQTAGFARHTVGMGLLLVVVVLWTASNFLGSVRLQIPRVQGENHETKPCCTTFAYTILFDRQSLPTIHTQSLSSSPTLTPRCSYCHYLPFCSVEHGRYGAPRDCRKSPLSGVYCAI